jgi:hypothetical protein
VRKCIDEETTPEYRDYIYRALTLDFVGVVLEFEDLNNIELITVKYLGTEYSARFHKISDDPQAVVETLNKILRSIEKNNECRLEKCEHMPESKRQFDCLRGQNMKYNLCYVTAERVSMDVETTEAHWPFYVNVIPKSKIKLYLYGVVSIKKGIKHVYTGFIYNARNPSARNANTESTKVCGQGNSVLPENTKTGSKS